MGLSPALVKEIMRRTLIFITILLALLGAVLFTETRDSRNEEIPQNVERESAVLSPQFLFAEEESTVVGLKIVIEESVLELIRDGDGLWSAVQPEGVTAEQGIVEAAVSQLRALPLLAEDLQLSTSDVGMGEQATQVSVSFADDTVSTFRVGDLSPSGSGYYIQSSDGQISIIARDSLDTFMNLWFYFDL